jgi:parvulin-like peptidyl-prolyl isomerase
VKTRLCEMSMPPSDRDTWGEIAVNGRSKGVPLDAKKCLPWNGLELAHRAVAVPGLVPVLLGVLLFAVGCAKKANPSVLVKVGTREFTIQDFDREVQWYLQNQQPLPERGVLLERMVQRELRLQKAKTSGLDKDPEVRRHYEAMLAGKVEELHLKPQLDALEVTPTEIRAVYEKEISRYSRPAKVRLALICIKTERRMSPQDLAEAASRIQAARQAALVLPAGTHGLGTVAAGYSEDQASRYRGGDVGWFDQGRAEYRWPTEVVSAGFALAKNGDISQVINAADGFYVVSRLDWREPGVIPLEQVQNALRRRLLEEKRQQVEIAFNLQLQSVTPVEIFTQALAKVQYPTTALAKAEETMPPMLHSANVSFHGKPPAN